MRISLTLILAGALIAPAAPALAGHDEPAGRARLSLEFGHAGPPPFARPYPPHVNAYRPEPRRHGAGHADRQGWRYLGVSPREIRHRLHARGFRGIRIDIDDDEFEIEACSGWP